MVKANVKISAIEYCLGEKKKESGSDLQKDNPDWIIE